MKPKTKIFRILPVEGYEGYYLVDSPETPEQCPRLFVIEAGDSDWIQGGAFEVTCVFQRIKPGVFWVQGFWMKEEIDG